MRKFLFLLVLAMTVSLGSHAQRMTDQLGRGLVAVPTGSTSGSKTNFISWRRLANEYYDVTYNLYKNGTRVATNLTNTCYNDGSNALPTTAYQVAAVVNGVEQTRCAAVTPWKQYVYKLGDTRTATSYLDIPLAAVYDRNGDDKTSHYEPNDAEMADLDGDGELEIIIKRLNTEDASATGSWGEMYSASNTTEYVVLDAYDVNWQTGESTLMWRIDCGPNMASLNSTEINIIAYDWDEDGKAEVVMRGADNMIVYGPDGKTQLWTIGDMTVNTRDKMSSHTNQQYAWTHTGAEYLIYMNGQTGGKYQVTTYPLRRLESGESSENTAWGDSYGHRSTKHFLGAPVLDGRHASLFLGRGIYTRHKMVAMDLDKVSHTWSERWRWACNDSNSPWYGNGYHNYSIADVDEDGRDEIVYGSMVIDDNGKGLSTTGYEHGDAMHVGDFNPYHKGLEFFGCLEDGPYYGANYRDATTSEVFYKFTSKGDDGRALMDNFLNEYPGAMGRSISSGMVSAVTGQEISALNGDTLIKWGDVNFRIYFDGDLCSEILNSPGTAREAKIEKPGLGRLFTSSGCNMNNDSKNNPCFQGDIIGDWREEIVVRCGQNLRVYTTGISTSYSMPSLWFDHQYRQAMVWQMMAYNQPPHLSFFLGELEGFNMAPPMLTMQGRTEVANGSTITTTSEHLLMAETNDMTVSVADGAAPYILTVNTPTWVQGTDVNGTTGSKVRTNGDVGATNLPEIITTTYTHTLTGGAFSGSMRLVKQGDGTLVLPKVTETYTGETNVWGGTLKFDGTLESSPLWMNRFTTLLSNGGTFNGGITALYASRIVPGGENSRGSISTSTLTLKYGARLVVDVYPNLKADNVNATKMVIETMTGDNWNNFGPDYLAPVIEVVAQGTLPDGTYDLGTIGSITGNVSDLVLEGISNATLKHENGHLRLVVGTGVAPMTAEATIAETTLQKTDEGILLPVVNITPNTFVSGDMTLMPQLTAIFTDLDGNESDADIVDMRYCEDYETAGEVSGWTNSGAPMSIATGDDTYGNYLLVNQGNTNTRRTYMKLSDVSVSDCSSYVIEFDLTIKAGNTDGVEFCVMSTGGSISSTVWENYASANGNANMLFDLFASKNATSFTVNGSSTVTTTLDNSKWYHYILNVDRTEGTVKWSISNGDSGTFTLPAGTSPDVAGFYILAGRYYSMFKLDNIRIYATDHYSYTFTRPGTLSVNSNCTGFVSAESTYEANFVGVEIDGDGLATLGCNYALDLNVNGLTAGVVNEATDGSAVLTPVVQAAAATGLLLKGDAGTYRLPIISSAQTAGTNYLHAVTQTSGYTVTTDDVYVLASKSHGTGFYRCSQGVTIPAGKAFLKAPVTQGARTTFISITDGQPTGIVLQEQPATDNIWFDLRGQRVAQPGKGVFIIDNKKVFIK